MEVLLRPKSSNAADMQSGDAEVAANGRAAHAEETQEIAAALKNMGLAFDDGSSGTDFFEDRRRVAQAVRHISAARAGLLEKHHEFWISSILSGLTTQVLNISTTAFNVLFRQGLMRPAEAAAGSLYQRLLGNDPRAPSLGEMPYFMQGVGPQAVRRAWANASLAWDLETAVLDDAVGAAGDAQGWRDQARGYEVAIAGSTGRVIRAPLRGLTAMDQFFKTLTLEMERGAQAYRLAKEQNLEGEAMQAFIEEETSSLESAASNLALKEAKATAFQSDTGYIGSLVTGAKADLQGSTDLRARLLGYALAKFIPFVKTLSNVFIQGARLTPALKAVEIAARVTAGGLAKAEVVSGRFKWTRGQMARDTVELGFGLMISTGAFMLAGSEDEEGRPYLTGSIDFMDEGARQKGYRDIPPSSLLVGGTYYDISRFAPFSIPLLAAADFQKAQRQGKSVSRSVGTAWSGIYRTFKESTLAAGMADLMKVIEQPGRAVPRWLSSFATGHVPNAFRSPLRNTDDRLRNRDSFLPDGAGAGTRITDWMRRTGESALPLASIQPPPYVNVWGEEARRYEGVSQHTDFLWRVTVPVRRKDTERFAADRLLTNWRQTLGEDSWLPTPPSSYFQQRGEKVQMTAREFHRYQVRAGRLAKERTTAKIEAGALSVEQPTEEDVEDLKGLIYAARRKVKQDMLREGAFSRAGAYRGDETRPPRPPSIPSPPSPPNF